MLPSTSTPKPPAYALIESYVEGKFGDPSRCEDAVVTLPHVVAVIDGATSHSPRRFNGMPGGLFAAHTLSRAFKYLNPEDAVEAQVAGLTEWLSIETERACGVCSSQLRPDERPIASLAYMLPQQRLLVMVGDCQAITGREYVQHSKRIDDLVGRVRARTLERCLKRGMTMPELLAMPCDPGRARILPLMAYSSRFQNLPGRRYSYGVFDGTPISRSLFQVHGLDAGAEVVLASDGYPLLRPSLLESEQELSRLLRADPLCMNELQGVKPKPGSQVSHDDRAYVRVKLTG